jgi:hypothetical protein
MAVVYIFHPEFIEDGKSYFHHTVPLWKNTELRGRGEEFKTKDETSRWKTLPEESPPPHIFPSVGKESAMQIIAQHGYSCLYRIFFILFFIMYIFSS